MASAASSAVHDILHNLGGSSTAKNIRLLCSHCNLRESNKLM
jgi:5-methylcytosine-specific restriction endonuclease McrA